jgi:hypothetical protein
MIERQKAWKYSTLGLLAILAIGLSIPQAAAHITNNTQHMLGHIYNFVDGIEAKTSNLPTDPADQSLIDSQLAGIQSDTDEIQASIEGLSTGGGASPKSVDVFLVSGADPRDPNFFRELLPFVPGKTYSGHINGFLTVDPANRVEIFCAVGGERQVTTVVSVANQGTSELIETFSEDFACDDLRLNIINDDLRTESSSTVIATIQYFESTDLTEMTS